MRRRRERSPRRRPDAPRAAPATARARCASTSPAAASHPRGLPRVDARRRSRSAAATASSTRRRGVGEDDIGADPVAARGVPRPSGADSCCVSQRSTPRVGTATTSAASGSSAARASTSRARRSGDLRDRRDGGAARRPEHRFGPGRISHGAPARTRPAGDPAPRRRAGRRSGHSRSTAGPSSWSRSMFVCPRSRRRRASCSRWPGGQRDLRRVRRASSSPHPTASSTANASR